MRLEIHQVSARAFARVRRSSAEEMVETHFEEIRRGGIARNMAAKFAISLVSAHDHGKRIPAQSGGELFLYLQIARITRLLCNRNGVDIRRDTRPRRLDTQRQRMLGEAVIKVLRAVAADVFGDCIERLQPFGGLLWIAVFATSGYRQNLFASAG